MCLIHGPTLRYAGLARFTQFLCDSVFSESQKNTSNVCETAVKMYEEPDTQKFCVVLLILLLHIHILERK